MVKTRVAKVISDTDVKRVQAYLPANYLAHQTAEHGIIIIGADSAGWTMDGYVIPRLASGLIIARELMEE
jgi:hypothetical protein